MWPWAHVAAAYLLYAGVVWYRDRAAPGDVAAIVLGTGALAPDLVDKPLAWYASVLPHGRTFAHSLLTGGVLVAFVVLLARRRGHAVTGGAFATGYVAHVAGDSLYPLLTGSHGDLNFLAWPVTTPPVGETVGLVAQLRSLELSVFVGLEFTMTGAGVALWWSHGRPGLSTVRRWAQPSTESDS